MNSIVEDILMHYGMEDITLPSLSEKDWLISNIS